MNVKNKSITIESKITLSFIMFVLAIFILLWLSLLFLFHYIYGSYQIDKIHEIAAILSKYEDDDVDYLLDDLAHKNDICILKLGSTTSEFNFKNSGCGLFNRTDSLNNIIIDYASSSNDDILYEFINHEEKVEAALLATQYKDSSVFIYTNLKDTSQIYAIFQNQVIYLTIISILISIIASYFVSKKIVEPLTKVTNNAKLLGTSNEIFFEKTGILEIDNLSDALLLAQSEIGKTHAFKRDLIANVSHDLKTPLTMIKAYAEMCRDISYKNKNKLDEHLNIIIDETNRLTLLVNDILDMSKMQDRKQIVNVEKFNLSLEINNLVKKYQIIKETEDYTFIVNIPNKVIINADKSKLNQVIYNLVNNAINHTGDDKKVFINLKRKNGSYLLEIIDTGKGISDKDLPFIWDKYFKTDKKHKRSVVSSGIGLSIVKEIFLLHNYKYGVKSSTSGTTFYFIIK